MTDKDGNISTTWLKIISIGTIVLVGVMVLAVFIMFIMNSTGHSIPSREIPVTLSEKYDSIMCEIQAMDSIADTNISVTSKNDSTTKSNLISKNRVSPVLIHKVLANQKFIIRQQNELLLDIRQETNNNIDKITLWLSFWIALIAALGVLIPALAEYRFRISNEQEMRSIESRATSINQRLERKEKDIDYLLKRLTFHEQINSLSAAWEDNIIDTFTDGQDILKIILRDMRQGLCEFCNDKSLIEDPAKCKDTLLHILIRIYDFMCRESNTIHKMGSRRVIDNTKDELRKAIKLTLNASSDTSEELELSLKKIIEYMKSLFGN